MNIQEYILNAIQRESDLEPNINLLEFNYIENGYIDSIGIIKFIAEMEDEFGIEFTDEEIISDEFRIIGSLIKLIERKVAKNEES